jgi:predicted DCC family thiol-disulfide oxidoreductase YuxK
VRRLLNDLARYLSELAAAARQGWNTFFFSPADPTALGVIRVCVGLMAFWSLLVFGLDLHDYFGSEGWAEPAVIRSIQRPLTWSFWFLVPDGWLRLVWCGALAVLLLYSAGVFSRVTAVLAWVIVVSTVRRLPIALYGFDQVLSALALYLAVSGASGQAVSLDRFWRRWRQARNAAAARPAIAAAGGPARRVSPEEPGVPTPSVSANLALRLIQLHIVLIYALAGLAKLQGPSWWHGMALWRTMTTGEFVLLDFTPLAAWPLVINLLTHASLAIELLYPILIWVRMLRPIMLAAVVALHAGIAVMSPGLAEFALIMLAGNIAFVWGSWLRRLATGSSQPALRVLYDSACPRCRASMALFTAADPDTLIEPVDVTAVDVASLHAELTRESCLRSMHVLTRSGRKSAGFDAMRSVAAWLPLFWPLALLGYFPGVAWTGRRVYNFLAATRPRDVTCTDEECGIHSQTPRNLPRNRGNTQNKNNVIARSAHNQEAQHP